MTYAEIEADFVQANPGENHGFLFGIYTEIGLTEKWSLLTDVFLQNKAFSRTSRSTPINQFWNSPRRVTYTYTDQHKDTYLSIPIALGYGLQQGIKIYIGAEASCYVTSREQDIYLQYRGSREGFRRNYDVGLVVGMRTEFLTSFNLDIRYVHSQQDINPEFMVDESYRTLQLTIGYKLN